MKCCWHAAPARPANGAGPEQVDARLGGKRRDVTADKKPAVSRDGSIVLSVISAQTPRVCREGKPVSTPHQVRGRLFPNHALADRQSRSCSLMMIFAVRLVFALFPDDGGALARLLFPLSAIAHFIVSSCRCPPMQSFEAAARGSATKCRQNVGTIYAGRFDTSPIIVPR